MHEHDYTQHSMACSMTVEPPSFGHHICATELTDVYLAIVADVVLDGPRQSHRNMRVLGCYRSAPESNAAATRCCVGMQTNSLSRFPNTVPSLQFQESNGLVNFEQSFADVQGNVVYSQHFWVQQFKLLGASSNPLNRLYVVSRSLCQDESESMSDESEEDDDEDSIDDETSHEEVVAVCASLEEADRLAGTCCFAGDTVEGDGVWMACVKGINV
eukprot:3758593-Rhodomonas_salina.1